MKKFALLCAISVVVAGLARADVGLVVQAPAITSGHATVTKDKVNVRARADKNSELVAQLAKGDGVEVLDRKGDWLKIVLPVNADCYVAAKFIKDGAATGDAVNIRCGPGTNYKDVGKLSRGEKVTVVAEKGEWIQIKATPHCSGWIAAEFVEIMPTPAPIQITEVVTPPVSLPPAVSAPAVPAEPEVQVQYVVKDGYVTGVKEANAPGPYALRTETVGGRDYIIAYLDAPQTNLSRYEGKHVRVLGNQHWARNERYPVIAVERIDMVW